MTVMLNVMLIGIGAYYAGTSVDNEVGLYTSTMEDFNSNFSENYGDTTTDTTTTILERTFGDTNYGGQMWWTLFKAGITVPKTCRGLSEEHCPQLERYMMQGYSYAIIIINSLLLFEIFLLLYTKKNS